MDTAAIIFWMVCLSCLTGLVVTWRQARSAARGWLVVFVAILAISFIGWLTDRVLLIYAGAVLWVFLILVPGLLSKLQYRRVLEQRYPQARFLSLVIRCLHPADGWLQQPQIMRALQLAQDGKVDEASEILNRHAKDVSVTSLTAMPIFFRITNRWAEFLEWEQQHEAAIAQLPQLLQASLRARGEVGDLQALVRLYAVKKSVIARLQSPALRDLCRLMLFAYCGKRELVEQLFAGNLSVLPTGTQKFWLATADLAGGRGEIARQELELLLPGADPLLRAAIQRRLEHGVSSAEALGRWADPVIESANRETTHEDSFSARPKLFSRKAMVTQGLILVNVVMFGVETLMGGSENLDTLYRLGGLYPAAARAGQWWRLLAALFLHYGPLHLILNMVGLWVLAPFVEQALGSRKFLPVYLLAGVGSMGFVMAFASGPQGEQMTVGASGGVMSLVGVTSAIMLRGWVRAKAVSAKRRLVGMAGIVALQTAFDALIPEVSMAGHLSGVVLGFLAALLVGDRLRAGLTTSKAE